MQISMFDGLNRFVIDKPIRLIELFAGIGSQAKALQNLHLNFEHYRICEFDKYAVQSYNAVHGTSFKTSDITKINANDLGITDTDKYCYIMTYSFPCQDLSNAGKQAGMAKGSGTRSGLLWEVERLLDECKELPQVLILENVPQIISQANIEHFAKWVEKLEKLGYKNKWQVLNAKDFGIPQNRERCFMVSILCDYYYDFPNKIPLTLRLKDMLEKEVDEKYYLSDSMLDYIVSKDDKYKVNENSLVINRNIACTINTRVGNTRADASDFICEDLPEDFNLKLIKPILFRIRKLTPKECWRLMGFSDSDVDKAIGIGMSNAQLYRQAGNSIVVNVLMAIFNQMI